jgi:GNAT superfamily N-acetyltransferase
MNCIIRRAKANDADELFFLVKEFATSFKPNRELFEDCLRQLVSDGSAWLSVAEYDKKVVGYCLGFDHYAFYANGRVSWVEEIMVDSNIRKKGIGAQLMKAFEEWARSRGSKLIGVATRRVEPFYSALGYEKSATFFRKLL